MAAPLYGGGAGSDAVLVTNLGTAAAVSQALAPFEPSGSGNEATLDAIHFIVIPQNPFALKWTAGAQRVVIVFSDEEPQSYIQPVLTSAQVSSEIIQYQARTYVLTSPEFVTSWSAAMPANWGQTRLLSQDPATMESQLMTVIKQVSCQ